MSIKFTTTEKDNPNISLLFEFLDHEVPEEVTISLKTVLGTNEFNGGLQSNQINGVFLEPISINGKFHGTYARTDDTGQNIITADERSQELGRLQGKIVKFFFENMTSYVIIEKFSRTYRDLCDIDFELILKPHDFQEVVKPEGVLYYNERGADLIKTELPSKDTGFDGALLNDAIKAGNELVVDAEQPISSVKTNALQTEIGRANNTTLQSLSKLTDRDNEITRELKRLNGEFTHDGSIWKTLTQQGESIIDVATGYKGKLLEEKAQIRKEVAGLLGYSGGDVREDVPLNTILSNSNQKMRFYNSYKSNPALKGITPAINP
jgi:hypothetical protein